MTGPCAALTIVLGLAVSESLGGTATSLPQEVADETAETEWEYFVIRFHLPRAARARLCEPELHRRPRLAAYLEARYNYEALKTGSLWLGYNFSVGKKLTLDATPMIGGVFGDITGIAPGYTISISYEPFELFTQGEYFFDAAIHAGNFFYSWSEVSYAPVT